MIETRHICELFERVKTESQKAYKELSMPLATLGEKGQKATLDHMNEMKNSCYEVGMLASELAGALDVYVREKDYR